MSYMFTANRSTRRCLPFGGIPTTIVTSGGSKLSVSRFDRLKLACPSTVLQQLCHARRVDACQLFDRTGFLPGHVGCCRGALCRGELDASRRPAPSQHGHVIRRAPWPLFRRDGRRSSQSVSNMTAVRSSSRPQCFQIPSAPAVKRSMDDFSAASLRSQRRPSLRQDCRRTARARRYCRPSADALQRPLPTGEWRHSRRRDK